MYGLLAGCGQALRGRARAVWQGHLCGLCESLSRPFGPPARLLTTPDAALLSLLVVAQSSRRDPASSPSRCLGRRPFYLRVPSTRSHGSRFARSIAVAAAAARLEDAARDGDVRPAWLPRLGTALLRPAARRADRDLQDLGFDPSILARAQQDTARLESAARDFDALAAPTQAAYAAVFGHTAVLAGGHGSVDAARQVGRWFGRLTYIEDARADHTPDLARGRFNPLAACFGAAARTRGADLASAAAQQLNRAIEGLRLARHQSVLSQLLSLGLSRRIAWACRRPDGARRLRVGEPNGYKRPPRRPRRPPRHWEHLDGGGETPWWGWCPCCNLCDCCCCLPFFCCS